MSKAVLIARILLGFIFVFFGLNHFLGFVELPPPNEDALAFMGALGATGYMWPVVKIVEIVGGAMLMAGAWVPLGLILLAPIIVNIELLHVFLDTGGLPLGIIVLALEIFLAWAYRDSFAEVLNRTAGPSA